MNKQRRLAVILCVCALIIFIARHTAPSFISSFFSYILFIFTIVVTSIIYDKKHSVIIGGVFLSIGLGIYAFSHFVNEEPLFCLQRAISSVNEIDEEINQVTQCSRDKLDLTVDYLVFGLSGFVLIVNGVSNELKKGIHRF
jgi:hypothetical protein